MRDAVRYLVDNSRCFVSVIPNAGLPLMGPKGETIYPETARRDGARRSARSFAISASTRSAAAAARRPRTSRAFRAVVDELATRRHARPHARAEAAAIRRIGDDGRRARARRQPADDRRAHQRARLAQDQAAAARGRTTTRSCSSRASRSRGGAHLLDVCTALTERTDEDVQMATIVKRLAQSTEAPLMIDSTEPRVIEAALKIYAGRAGRQLDQSRERPRRRSTR